MLTRGVFPPSFPDLMTLYCSPEGSSITPSFSLFAARKAFPSCSVRDNHMMHPSTHGQPAGPHK